MQLLLGGIVLISFYGMTRVGKRDKNEDYFGIWQDSGMHLFALADGLGGHKRGEVASRLVVETSINVAQRKPAVEMLLDKCFTESQKELMAEQVRSNMVNDMKTTLVLLYMDKNRAAWGHIGDSRLYRFKKGLFGYSYERTTDHSVVQNMALSGQIKEKDIRFHEDRNVLLRVMGTEWDSPKYSIDNRVELKNNDSYLLCTDGFWEWIDEKQMIDCLKSADTPQQWLDMMEKIIVKNVGSSNCDNYTAIAVFVRKD
jgi:serine/threonine protein phosphatase PrpC